MAVLPEGAPFLPMRVSTQATRLPSGEMAVCSNVLAANRVFTAACKGERFADAWAGGLAAARGFAADAAAAGFGGAGLSCAGVAGARPARARPASATQVAIVRFAGRFLLVVRDIRSPL